MDAITRWRRYLTSERRVSPHTLAAYSRDFGDFITFLASYRGAQVSLRTFEKLEVRDFRAFLAARRADGASARSTARALSSIRNFYRFLAPTMLSMPFRGPNGLTVCHAP